MISVHQNPTFHWRAVLLVGLLSPTVLFAQDEATIPEPAFQEESGGGGLLPESWVSSLTWRSIGPSSMSGRVVAFSVIEDDPRTFWVGLAGGGLLKTTNNGMTFEHQFDHENTFAIGDVCHAPSNPDIVWVGTGEQNPIRSGSNGDGVYKSTDGGTTWEHMGLRETFAIGRIAIHPTNPDIVYVGAQGRLYGPNPERGLYKTIDGGQSWEQILFVNNLTGVIDVKMHPTDPDTLMVATYERQRDEYDGGTIPKSHGPGAGLFKTTNGGNTFVRLRSGLPEEDWSRAGVAYSYSNPDVVYAIIGSRNRDTGGVYRSADGGETWSHQNTVVGGPVYYYGKIYVDPNDENRVFILSVRSQESTDGGVTFTRNFASGPHVDSHALWIDRNNSEHILLGNDGGAYFTYDRGDTWDHMNNVAVGTFYHVSVDNQPVYWVYGGLQDNGSWAGPNRTRNGGTINEDWVSIGGGDGFVAFAHPDDPNIVFAESQNGAMSRRDLRTNQSTSLRPQAPEGERYRFNWKTPMMISQHNSSVFYAAGNRVFKSDHLGDDLQAISPEITRNNRGAATALAESPLDANVLYVGSEDGALWATTDGGDTWINRTYNVPLPGPRWVATLEASRYAVGRVYAAFDAHRSDDDNPYVYVSEDYGATWHDITSNLPWGPTRALREDAENESLLYVGHEYGVFASLDRGLSWTKINNNHPTVSVQEIAVHPTAGEIVTGTHGRSFWILDVTALRQMTPETLAAPSHLYQPADLVRWRTTPRRGRTGMGAFVGENPPAGAQIFYSLNASVTEASLAILDSAGESVRTLQIEDAGKEPGLHRITWDGRGNPPVQTQGGQGGRGARGTRGGARGARGRGGRGGGRGRRGGGGRGRGGQRAGPLLPLGTYSVVLTLDGTDLTQVVEVVDDPESVTPPHN
jgi:photosystem II stability/assembly factor-like uncharacterized protein